jgi:hypothetical protein
VHAGEQQHHASDPHRDRDEDAADDHDAPSSGSAA